MLLLPIIMLHNEDELLVLIIRAPYSLRTCESFVTQILKGKERAESKNVLSLERQTGVDRVERFARVVCEQEQMRIVQVVF